MHFMSTLYYTTFLDFLRTQHMTYFENSWFILAFTTYVDVLVLICTSTYST